MAANHDIRLAAARMRQARAQLGIAAAGFGPSIAADAGVTRIAPTQDGPLPIPLSPFTLWDAGFDASWEIDLWGAVRREHEAAAADLDATAWESRAIMVSVAAEMIRAYVSLEAAAQRARLAQQLIAVKDAQAALEQRRFSAGRASEEAVGTALGARDRALALPPPLRAEIAAERYRLAVLVGQDPGALDALLAAPAPLPDLPIALSAGIPADLLRRRPDLHAAERRLAAATARIGVAEADFYPRLSLDGTFGVASTSASTLASKAAVMWSIGPSLRWRLLDWGRTRNGVEAARAEVDAALIGYDGALRTAEEEVAGPLVACAQDRLRCAALASAVLHAALVERIARSQRERGLLGDRPVLDAEEARLTAEDQLVSARLAMAIATVALAKALGGGWEPAEAPSAAAQLSVAGPPEVKP